MEVFRDDSPQLVRTGRKWPPREGLGGPTLRVWFHPHRRGAAEPRDAHKRMAPISTLVRNTRPSGLQ